MNNDNHASALTWKRVGGAALVILALVAGVFLALGNSAAGLLAYLPFLLILACPLMMIFMMGSMNSMGTMNHHSRPRGLQDGAYDNRPTMEGLTRDEKVWALRYELTSMAWRQESLRQELERLETDKKTVTQ